MYELPFTVPLDECAGRSELSKHELIPAQDSLDFIAEVELRDLLSGALGRLKGRELEVILGTFGLDGGPPRPATRVAKELGCSRQRVNQLKQRALGKMRSYLAWQAARAA